MFNLAVAFALVTGTAAGLLSLLTWEIFRYSPLGRVVFALSTVMSLLILYHVLLLVFQAEPFVAELVRSVAYTGLVVFILLMIRVQYRLHVMAEPR